MMKVGPRFSFSLTSVSLTSAIFILILCFTPGALAESAVTSRAGGGSAVLSQASLSQTLPGLLVFGPQADLRNSEHNRDGCDARGREKRGGCTTVPEGGTAFTYLALVALSCLTAGIFMIRRQTRSRETK
jgi:hypothetical protein